MTELVAVLAFAILFAVFAYFRLGGERRPGCGSCPERYRHLLSCGSCEWEPPGADEDGGGAGGGRGRSAGPRLGIMDAESDEVGVER